MHEKLFVLIDANNNFQWRDIIIMVLTLLISDKFRRQTWNNMTKELRYKLNWPQSFEIKISKIVQ